MPRRPTEAQLFQELLDRYGREIADAFLKAVQAVRDEADLQRVISAIQAGNIEAAIEALHLDPAAYSTLAEAIRSAYLEGGTTAVPHLPTLPPGTVGVVRFDIRNLAAEAWLRDHSSTLITRILDDQRLAIRQRLAAGMEAGANPRTTALNIIGRIDRLTGKRTGGIIGLSSVQEGYLATARTELASADLDQLRNFLTRARRDKRYDRSILKAIREGRALDGKIAAAAGQAYESRLLTLRAETIARTESLTALNASRYEAARQMIDSANLSAADVQMTWRSAHDARVRHSHQALDGDTARFGEAFTSPSGARMRFPGDASLGAPASEIIGCRCICSPRLI